MKERHQVSLLVTEDKTNELVNQLKSEKRLKSVLVKFLDKFAENPLEVETWLTKGTEEKDSLNGSLDSDNNKITEIRENLEIFKSFVSANSFSADSLQEDVEGSIRSGEFAKYRISFEKARQEMASTEALSVEESAVSSTPTQNLENMHKDIEELKQQLQLLVNNTQTVSSVNAVNTENPVTNDATQGLSVPPKVEEKVVEIVEQEGEISESNLPESSKDTEDEIADNLPKNESPNITKVPEDSIEEVKPDTSMFESFMDNIM